MLEAAQDQAEQPKDEAIGSQRSVAAVVPPQLGVRRRRGFGVRTRRAKAILREGILSLILLLMLLLILRHEQPQACASLPAEKIHYMGKYKEIRDLYYSLERSRLRTPRYAPAWAKEKTIYFLAPDYDKPSGGNRVIYQHVDILNAAGISSAVVHQRRGFRYSWFANTTRIQSVAEAALSSRDLLVVPEMDVDLVRRLNSNIRVVVFNQNSHLTWKRHNSSAIYDAANVRAVIVVSQHNQDMINFAFPRAITFRVNLSLDEKLFHPPDVAAERKITYMPRRGADDAHQVLEMLRPRTALRDWEVVAIDGVSHDEVGEHLRKSRIFLAFTYQEGFGLPAAEAMACGNYVIGVHGYGGGEFFRPSFCSTIAPGDVLNFAKALEAALEADARDPEWCRARGLEASRFVRTEYSFEREKRDVTQIYSSLIQ
jgi:glycosyltransferase involved in cell wall biosynthesis